MSKQIRNVRLKCLDEDARLYGIDIGDYPRHHFSYPLTPEEAAAWPLQIAFAGADENIGGWWRERKNSDVFSLEWMRSGVFEFTQNGSRYVCNRGDLFMVRQGADSRMKCLGDYAEKWTVALSGSALTLLLNILKLDRVDVLRALPEKPFCTLFEKVFQLLNRKRETPVNELAALGYRLLLELADAARVENRPAELAALLAFIENHLAEKLTVEILADRQKVCRRTLSKLFRRHFGQTPMEYVIVSRMRLARTLLKGSRQPVKEVARNCGYPDALYFSSEFRRHCGVSPSQYRRGGSA